MINQREFFTNKLKKRKFHVDNTGSGLENAIANLNCAFKDGAKINKKIYGTNNTVKWGKHVVRLTRSKK